MGTTVVGKGVGASQQTQSSGQHGGVGAILGTGVGVTVGSDVGDVVGSTQAISSHLMHSQINCWSGVHLHLKEGAKDLDAVLVIREYSSY